MYIYMDFFSPGGRGATEELSKMAVVVQVASSLRQGR